MKKLTEVETDVYWGVRSCQDDRQFRQFINRDINKVISQSTMVEMEHVEFYFKPKEKYVEAFIKLQKLFNIIKAVRYTKIHLSDIISNCICVENEDFFQAINIFTGELDLRRFLQCMNNSIKKRHITKYVSDEVLRAELLEALEEYASWDSDEVNTPDYHDSITNVLDFLHSSLINTIDKMNLTDCIVNDQGAVKMVINIMQLGNKNYLSVLGTILGTLADRIERIVYVDGRARYKVVKISNLVREYKLLEFDTVDNKLIIKDIRVPDFKGHIIKYTREQNVPEEDIKTTTISIPLIDKAQKYHIKIEADIKEECKQPLDAVFELVSIMKKAFEEKRLVSTDDNKGDYTEIINSTVFGAMLYNFNITQQVIYSLDSIHWLYLYNKREIIKEVFKNISNPDIKAAVLDDNIKDEKDYLLAVGINYIDMIYENNIRNGKWIFEADYKAITNTKLEAFFNKIISNIGVDGRVVFNILQL